MNRPPVIVWFRQDLRIADNPALHSALQDGRAVIPLFIHAPDEEAPWIPGGASRWWLHQSLAALDARLRALGSRLVIRRGPALTTLLEIAKETHADTVHWNRRYEPGVMTRDREVKESVRNEGLTVESFNGAMLHEPWTIQNKSKKPFQVFTPYWKHCLTRPDPEKPQPAPKSITAPPTWPSSLALEELELDPKINWSTGFGDAWQPGEAGATANLTRFLKQAFEDYVEQRNRPDLVGTSRLSPHLHFGEISPRQVWHGLRRRAEKVALPAYRWRGSQFLAEIGWREFSHHLLFHFQNTPTEPLRKDFLKFRWRKNDEGLRAWQKGRTGYPIVDAGMRELWTTGWMHNRVRMIAASFLVKDLLIDWQEGARWFWETLVDADLAQNTMGWQWTAGCGADAAPFFRVFNPTRQGAKFDPQGDYVRKWCPELAQLPDRWLHQPHAAPTESLQLAGVELGHNYPHPIICHTIAREVALDEYVRNKDRAAAVHP